MTRITAEMIEAAIVRTDYFTAAEGVMGSLGGPIGLRQAEAYGLRPLPEKLLLTRLITVTICVLTLANGHVAVGVNYGPISARDHQDDFARKDARRIAFDSLWPLFGFALREQLAAAGAAESSLGASALAP